MNTFPIGSSAVGKGARQKFPASPVKVFTVQIENQFFYDKYHGVVRKYVACDEDETWLQVPLKNDLFFG